MIDHTTDRLTKAEVGRTKAEKDSAKLEKALSSEKLTLETLDDELAELDHSMKENAAASELVRKEVEKATEVLVDKKEELAEMKGVLDEKLAIISRFRAREVRYFLAARGGLISCAVKMELQQQLEKTKRALKENTDQLAHWHSKLETLKLNDIDDEDNTDDDADKNSAEAAEGDGERQTASVDRRRQPVELITISDEELEQYSPDELKGDIAMLEGSSSGFVCEPSLRGPPNVSLQSASPAPSRTSAF
jgi:structural maintenance of chromosome 4